MYKKLRRIRIAVSLAFIVALTAAIADAWFGATPVGRWLVQVQLVPAILTGATLWIVFWVIVTLSVGRVYCSSVCPLGTLQDCTAHLGRRFGKNRGARYAYSAPLNALRFPIPGIVAACLFAGITVVVDYTDPYTLYTHIVKAVVRPAAIGFGSIAAGAVVLLAVSFVSWRKGRIICNTVCPAGGMFGLLSRSPIYRIDIDTDKCIHCGKCEEVCKSECIDLTDCVVDVSRCVMCFDCTAVCPNEAITLRRGRHQLSIPMMQRTIGPATPTACTNNNQIQSVRK